MRHPFYRGLPRGVEPWHHRALVIGIGELLVIAVILVTGLGGLAATAFWIYAIIDCARSEAGPGGEQVLWLLVIIVGGVIGALIYWFVRRPKRRVDVQARA